MASTDARPIPIKNTAYRVTFPLFDADGDLVTGAASLDSEVSKDGGTFADCTNEATEIATSSGMYYLDLTSTEMNADTVAVIVKSASAKTTPLVMYPQEAGDIKVDVESISGDTAAADNLEAYSDGTTPQPVNVIQLSGDAPAADNAEAFFDGTGYAGTNNVIPTVTIVNGLAAGVITAAAIATGAIDADAIADGAIDAGAIAADAITAAKIADGAIDAATFATGAITAAAIAADAIGASELAADAVAEIADAVWDEATSGHTTGGTFGEQCKTDIDAILADTGTDGVALAANSITAGVIADGAIDAGAIASDAITAAKIATGAIDADALAADAVDEILDEVVDGSLTMRQVLRLVVAFVSGKTSGGATTSITFRDSADSKNRIVMTVDSDGDRSAVTTDVT